MMAPERGQELSYASRKELSQVVTFHGFLENFADPYSSGVVLNRNSDSI